MSVPELGFMSYSSWTHRDASPPQPCFVAWDKLFCGGRHENSLMVLTVHKFQYQPKAWRSTKTQQTCLQPYYLTQSDLRTQAESGMVSTWMGDSTISGGIGRCKMPKWWEGKVVLALPWSVHSWTWAPMLGITHQRDSHKQEFPESEEARRKLFQEIVEGRVGIPLWEKT